MTIERVVSAGKKPDGGEPITAGVRLNGTDRVMWEILVRRSGQRPSTLLRGLVRRFFEDEGLILSGQSVKNLRRVA